MSDDGARRASASVSGVSETSTSSRSGSALEHALEASSRAGVREQAAQRALGGGNVLYDPLGVFLAGERAVASVAGSIDETAETRDGGADRNDDATKRKRPVAVVAASAVRHRAIDDVILRECSSARDGVRQVVVIQPGFGTRPYRLALPDVTWFEVDAMEVLLLKRHLIRAAGGGEKSKPLGAAPSFGGAGKAKTAAGAQETPFAHLATPSVRDVKLVGFDVKKEILAASRGGGGAGSVGADAAGADANKKQNASKSLSTSRLAAALEKAGFDVTKPCVLVIEDALTTLEPREVRFLMRSLPACAPGSTLVIAGVPRRVKKWAERNAKAALASGSATVDPDALRLAEIASRWRCDLERCTPREKGWFLFPFKNRFVKSVSASLATHAAAYGAVADADVCRADAERVAEFKKKKRGFLGLPGAPGVFLFPVKPKTLVNAFDPFIGKVPVLSAVLKKLNLLDDDATYVASSSSKLSFFSTALSTGTFPINGSNAFTSVFGLTGNRNTPGAPGRPRNPLFFFLNSATRSASARHTSASATAPYAAACVARLALTLFTKRFLKGNRNQPFSRGVHRSRSQRHRLAISAKRRASGSTVADPEASAAFAFRSAHFFTRRGTPAMTKVLPGAHAGRLRMRNRTSRGSRVVSASSMTNTHGFVTSKPAFSSAAARRDVERDFDAFCFLFASAPAASAPTLPAPPPPRDAARISFLTSNPTSLTSRTEGVARCAKGVSCAPAAVLALPAPPKEGAAPSGLLFSPPPAARMRCRFRSSTSMASTSNHVTSGSARRYGRVPNPGCMTTTCRTPSRAEEHSRRITSSIARCRTAEAATTATGLLRFVASSFRSAPPSRVSAVSSMDPATLATARSPARNTPSGS